MGKFKPGKPAHDPFAARNGNKAAPPNRWAGKSILERVIHDLRHDAIPTPEPPRRIISEDDMWWQTRGGEKMLASAMETRHLYYSLRLLYNKTVLPHHRVSELKGGTVTVGAGARAEQLRAIRILFKLLNKRIADPARLDEFEDSWLEALIQMQKIVRTYL